MRIADNVRYAHEDAVQILEQACRLIWLAPFRRCAGTGLCHCG
jgi:hypothetical protein